MWFRSYCKYNCVLKDYKFRFVPLKESEKGRQQVTGQKNPENFEQFFGIITSNFKPSEVDEQYNVYVESFRLDHEKFLNHFTELTKKMIKNESKISEIFSRILKPKVPDYIAKARANQNQNYIQKSSAISISTQDIFSDEQEDEDEESKASEDETTVSCPDESINTVDDTLEKKKAYYTSYYNVNNKVSVSKQFDLNQEGCRKQISSEIMNEINDLAGCQFILWNLYVELLRENTVRFTKILLDEYQTKISDHWGQSIFRYSVVVKELYNFVDTRVGKSHIKQARKYRKKPCFKDREPLNVEDINLFPKAKYHPILFHEVYTQNKYCNADDFDTDILKRDEAHVIVFVHGFQGSSFDLRLFSNNITIRHPEAIFLHSSSNEDNTDGDIQSMGNKLAEEVKKFVASQLYGKRLKRLSFVGHSLGGLIIRSALPLLQKLEDYFFAFMTFSSPHMGFMFSNSMMVNAGLWFLKTWNKSECIKQMTMADSKDIKKTFIYQLAFKPGLQKFKHIILFSSPQDEYVPFHSARMQQTIKQQSDQKNSIIYDEMLKEIFNKISVDRIHRVDVSFEIAGKVIDKFIGRAAHIQFLENEFLMKMILSDFKHVFI